MEYLKFWHLFPRIVYSLTTIVGILFLIPQEREPISVHNLLKNFFVTQNDFWNGFLIVVLLLSISWFVSILQEGFLHLVKKNIRSFLRLLFKGKTMFPFIQLKTPELVRVYFKMNSNEITNHFKYTNLAVPEIFAKYDESLKQIEEYYLKLESVFLKYTNLDMIFSFIYEGTQTIEQNNLDMMRRNKSMLEFSVILIPVLLFDIYFWGNILNLFVVILISLIWVFLVFYFHKRLRINYIYSMIFLYFQLHKVEEPGEDILGNNTN